MKTLKVFPHSGLLKRFPLHFMAEKDKQYVFKLKNLLNLDNKIRAYGFTEKINSVDAGGTVTWAKRLYYKISGEDRRRQFAVINRKIYRLNDDDQTLSQMPINGSLDIQLEPGYQQDTSIKVSGNTVTYLVDGKYFYKFVPNDAGYWERIPILTDVDGNNIEPIDCVEYLDRMWVLCKNRNVILHSKNSEPENFSDSTDAGLIDTPAGNGGYPQRLIVHRGFLLGIHNDYIAPVSGSSTATFGIKPGDIIHGYGTRAPRSVVNLKTSFAFLNSTDNEIYTSSGTLDSTSKQPTSYHINLKNLINPTKANLTVCHYDTIENLIRVSYVPSGETVNNAEIIYSVNEEKWCGETYGQKISCYSQWDGSGDAGELITGRSNAGYLMWFNRSQQLDGGALSIHFISGEYLVGNEEDVEFEDFYLDAKPTGNFTVPVSYYLDSRLTTEGSDQINLQGELLNPGFAIDLADQKEFINRGQFLIDKSKGRTIRFEIMMDLNQRELEWYGMYVRYNTGAALYSKYISGR